MQKLGCSLSSPSSPPVAWSALRTWSGRVRPRFRWKTGVTIKVTGCVERNVDGGFMLTNVANKEGALGSYLLAVG